MEKYRIAVVVVVATVVVLGFYAWRRLSDWETYTGSVTGTHIEGDTSVSPTHWYNHWYLAWRGWKTVAVFAAQTDTAYRVGYKPIEGDPQVQIKLRTDKRIKMKIGHEACHFFALDSAGNEVELTLVARTTVDDADYADVPQL